ncbi:hypothetical protein ACK12G_36500, partial [Mycolicibacterium wolinskyi]|uniref:hypothetical protein n=1 Tax=Mycolicibacterium wolinskyi TaxID=59750 RepID=UPI0039177E87
ASIDMPRTVPAVSDQMRKARRCVTSNENASDRMRTDNKSESAPSEARQQTADAEVVDPAETVYRDIAAEEAEIVERANDPESLDEGSSTVDDADDVEANIQKKIIELDLPMEHKRSLVRVVTGKPFLKNCTPEEMTKVAEAIEEIEAGTFEKPQEWLKTAA